jgi:hypothetical protein
MTTRRLVRIAFLSAILSIAMIALKPLPNVELVSLLVIIYSLLFGKDSLIIVTIFTLIEGIIWGFGLWWVSYLYVWPLLCLVVFLLQRFIKEEFLIWAVVSGAYGLIFGALFAIAYIPVDPAYALSYWIAGLPWDVWHAVGNFVLMAVVGRPVYRILKKVHI